MRKMEESIYDYYRQEKEIISKLDYSEIEKSVQAIIDTYHGGGIIYTCGNGGSASTASHIANDFNKGISEHLEKKFNVVCLCDNFSTVMAIANDISYEEVFSYQLNGRLRKEDLLIAISGSGNSSNVVNAANYAKSIGTPVIGMTGYDGGKLYNLSNFHLHVPVNDMQITEDIHLTFDHMMYRILSDELTDWKQNKSERRMSSNTDSYL